MDGVTTKRYHVIVLLRLLDFPNSLWRPSRRHRGQDTLHAGSRVVEFYNSGNTNDRHFWKLACCGCLQNLRRNRTGVFFPLH